MVTTSTSWFFIIVEKSYKSFKPDVFPPPWIQNITGSNLCELLTNGALISKYKQSSVPEKYSSPSEPPRPEGSCTQKLSSLGLIILLIDDESKSWGARHLKSLIGGFA